jgi:Protein of unknown function (DUF4229)
VSDRPPRSRLVADVLAYTVARLLLVVVLTAVIFGAGHLLGVRDFPLVVALLFAIVIALPLGIWIFAPLRRRATASIAVFDERRREDREQLQARLRGEETSSGDEPAE